MKVQEKKLLLMRFFELHYILGIDFSFYMGKPLSWYNWEGLKKTIAEMEERAYNH